MRTINERERLLRLNPNMRESRFDRMQNNRELRHEWRKRIRYGGLRCSQWHLTERLTRSAEGSMRFQERPDDWRRGHRPTAVYAEDRPPDPFFEHRDYSFLQWPN